MTPWRRTDLLTGQPDALGAGTIQGGSMYARGASPRFEEPGR